MVTEKLKHGRKYFICGECGFAYEDEGIAKKCEEWCNEHHSCNIEIAKNAVQLD